MRFTLRQRLYLGTAFAVFALHLFVAALLKPSFGLTMFGDAIPCVLLAVAILAMRENFRNSPGILPLFWKVFAAGLLVMFLSQFFWFYFDWRRLTSQPSPAPGDALFLVAHAFFLAAIALRPHSASARGDLRVRSLDLVLLSLWWLCLYAYFAVPWMILAKDLDRYTRNYCLAALFEHLAIILAFGILCLRKSGAWRIFYFLLALAFVLIAGGNLLMSSALPGYYAGGFYDTPFLAALCLFTLVACLGASLQPHQDPAPSRDLVLSIWTARVAMLLVMSLPVIALWGLTMAQAPRNLAAFRLRLIFGSMFVLGSLVYWKLNLLSRELLRLVRLTRDSIENLKTVQEQVSHSEKFVALGRLAAGAAHEISNPLTAILGYSELLEDIPSLLPEDRAHAKQIREQVHRAQAAVTSLRNTLRQGVVPPPSLLVDKKADS